MLVKADGDSAAVVTDGTTDVVGTGQQTPGDKDGTGVVIVLALNTVFDRVGNIVVMVTEGTIAVVGPVKRPLFNRYRPRVVIPSALITDGRNSVLEIVFDGDGVSGNVAMVTDGTMVAVGSVKQSLFGRGGPGIVIAFILKTCGRKSVPQMFDGN